jgi:cardiolipin synthase
MLPRIDNQEISTISHPAIVRPVRQRQELPFATRLRKVFWRIVWVFLLTGWIGVLLLNASATLKQWALIFGSMLVAYAFYLFRPGAEEPRYGLNHEFAIDDDQFLPSIAGATDMSFLPGNSIQILNNGDEFYPSMLKAIDEAQRSVTIEAYIYWAGEIGKRFALALAGRASAGVKVKILLDAVGSATISDEILETLKDGGCEVEWYNPIHWYTIDRVNNRTHRKSLIIDGRIGFTGGAGIADHWLGDAEDPKHWRDIQIRIEGPAVMPLQSAFARNWLETTGEMISGGDYYPPHETAGPLSVQSILSSPETGSSTVRIMYYLSIACARKNIYIANPYFIPNDQAIDILVASKQRGVDVKIMISGVHNDNMFARYNSTRLYGRLLEAGVEIYEYNRTMLHHKIMVCDGLWSTAGTTNFDDRSFAHNEENNVCVYDRNFAAEWEGIFLNDLKACEPVTLRKWRERGLVVKATELFVALFKSQV